MLEPHKLQNFLFGDASGSACCAHAAPPSPHAAYAIPAGSTHAPRVTTPPAPPRHALAPLHSLHSLHCTAFTSRHSLASLHLHTQAQHRCVARRPASVPDHHACIRARTCARLTPPQHTAHLAAHTQAHNTSLTSTAGVGPPHGLPWPPPLPPALSACACAAENHLQRLETFLFKLKVLILLQDRHFWSTS